MPVKRVIKEKISDCVYCYKRHANKNFFNGKKCRILLYHAVQRSNLHEDKMGLALPEDAFYMQMKYLKENGFHVIGLAELANIIIDKQLIPEKSVAVTFDDGYKSVLTEALPVLKEFNFPCTLFINIFFIEKRIPKNFYWHSWDTLNWEEVKELYGAGLSIGSHALSHRRLVELNNQELQYEILKSKDLIESYIEGKINMFSYPHGAFNRNIERLLRENNFICSCSSIDGANDTAIDIFALRRTEISAFDDTPLKFEKKISGCYDWLRFFKAP